MEDESRSPTVSESPAKGNVTFSQFQKKFFTNYYQFGLNKQSGDSLKVPSSKSTVRVEKSPDKGEIMERFCSLSERLTKVCETFSSNQIIDQNIFRKYIAYAKKNIHP